jgi:hypothetical protein
MVIFIKIGHPIKTVKILPLAMPPPIVFSKNTLAS